MIRKGAEAFLHLLPEADQKQQMSMMRFGSQELRYMAVSWSKSEERPERRKRPPATRGEASPRKAREVFEDFAGEFAAVAFQGLGVFGLWGAFSLGEVGRSGNSGMGVLLSSFASII